MDRKNISIKLGEDKLLMIEDIIIKNNIALIILSNITYWQDFRECEVDLENEELKKIIIKKARTNKAFSSINRILFAADLDEAANIKNLFDFLFDIKKI